MDNNRDIRQTSKLQEPDLKIPVSGQDSAYQQHSQLIKTQLNPSPSVISKSQEESLIRYNHITYLLYVLSYFTAGLLWIVPIIMNYARRGEAEYTWLSTHFDWQIKTFWYSIVFFVIGSMLILFALGGLGVSVMADSGNLAIGSIVLTGLGIMIIAFTFIWHLYRIVRGWIALTDNRPVP